MVTVLLWVFAVFGVAMILLFLYGFYLGFTEQTTHRTVISLYDIRRRIQVAQLKTELRRDAADLRRDMRRELDEQGKL
jgi:hypothetical protein